MAEDQIIAAEPAIATLVDLPTHAALLLDDPAQTWLIASGEVTLFPRRGGADSARHCIATLSAGSLLCGLGQDLLGTRVIAIGTAETTLQPINLTAVLDDPNGLERVVAGIILLTRALAEGLARPMAPRPVPDVAVSLAAGRVAPAPGSVVVSCGPPIWTRLQGGA